MPESVKNRYPCDQCDKRFSTKPNLVTHKRIHTGIRNFTCDQCGKSFIQKGNLDAHLLTHSVDKPHLCPICNKGFKTPLQLRKHQTVHTGAKPHQCDVCGRQFRERGTLREHHRIHTGAMPFTCEFCGKSFRFKGILTTHRRQHTGERPYSCLECQHHFTNWPNYNKHMKRRHGINTSHQPDPNKIALANLANAGNNANVGPTNSTSTPTTLLVMRQQQEQHPHPHPQHQSQPQTPGTPAEHCQAILGLASDLLDHPTLPTGAPSVQYNHHAAPDPVSCVSPGTMATHSGVCVSGGDPAADQHMYQNTSKSIGPTTHFYNPTPSVHVGPYVGATAVPANVLGFYNLPQITGLEGAGPMDLLPPVQQR